MSTFFYFSRSCLYFNFLYFCPLNSVVRSLPNVLPSVNFQILEMFPAFPAFHGFLGNKSRTFGQKLLDKNGPYLHGTTFSCRSTLSLYISHYSTTQGWMQVDCGSWIQWLVTIGLRRQDRRRQGNINVQRRAEHYHDDGEHVGLRLPLLSTVMMAAITLPPRTNRRSMTKKRNAEGENTRNPSSCKNALLDCVLSTNEYLI